MGPGEAMPASWHAALPRRSLPGTCCSPHLILGVSQVLQLLEDVKAGRTVGNGSPKKKLSIAHTHAFSSATVSRAAGVWGDGSGCVRG